jgi:hypothetical protein
LALPWQPLQGMPALAQFLVWAQRAMGAKKEKNSISANA